jgi:hypothetical protein
VVEFSAFSARLRRKEQGNSAVRPQYKGTMFAVSMVVSQLGLKPPPDDNAAQQLRPSTALKRAKREPNGHWACVGFGS